MPVCTGKQVLVGFNDLQTLYPDLIRSEWNYANNNANNIRPDEITCGSDVEAHWSCKQYKHAFIMRVNKRTGNQPRGCPVCAGKQVLAGFNDLASCYPNLVASEWNWSRNNMLKIYPDEITKNSSVKVWWKCSTCSHEWKAMVANRTSTCNKTKCPDCVKHGNHHISHQENEVAEFINDYIHSHYQQYDYTMHRSIAFSRIYADIHVPQEKHMRRELDIYIPELKLSIEYDGDYWHSDEVMLRNKGMTNTDAHRIKQLLCEHVGIELFFITEHDWLNDTVNVKQMLTRIIDNMMLRIK